MTMTSDPATATTSTTSTTSTTATTDAALPLSSVQRIILRDLLNQIWRAHVVDITNLAVRFHSDEEAPVARALAAARRKLVDVESALERLDSGSYGRCDGCERRIPFELLEAAPDCRYCRRCQPR
jgi:RNA polymerase-binding transcription factor DksA